MMQNLRLGYAVAAAPADLGSTAQVVSAEVPSGEWTCAVPLLPAATEPAGPPHPFDLISSCHLSNGGKQAFQLYMLVCLL